MTNSPPRVDPVSTQCATISAPAKINLILRILDRRADGYHNLWSVMHTVALEDEVQIRLVPDRQEIRLRCDADRLATDRTNLVHRAATAVLERARLAVGLEIRLSKRIPMGAGLGGGSSDAAATIIGLNHLFGLGWSRAEMAAVGQSLGSDVSFFFFAPSALVSGRGETVRPVSVPGSRWVVLVNPGFGVETEWAYRQLSATRSSVRPLSLSQSELDRHVRFTWTQLADTMENDFEPPVFEKYGMLGEIRQSLRAQGADIALLSGSGATVFGLFRDEVAAKRVQSHFAGAKDMKVFVVPTCSEALAVR